jgi:hypothetical protein
LIAVHTQELNSDLLKNLISILFYFSDIDTDEISGDSKNNEEEVVEFFVKEETTIVG